jgi:hypothetical protein
VIARREEVVGDGPDLSLLRHRQPRPGFAPGTGTPEVGGLTPREALALLRGCAGLDIVAGDVVEVAPQYDAATADRAGRRPGAVHDAVPDGARALATAGRCGGSRQRG